MEKAKRTRKESVSTHRRQLILEAAQKIFESEGLEGASLRAIAASAGYTPQALYFHFDSKEALYAELLQQSLTSLESFVSSKTTKLNSAEEKLKTGALAFFEFYADNPRDLDLGFYLLRGGMKPAGLGHERDLTLNAGLEAALKPIETSARDLGASAVDARNLVADIFAHATGLLLLLHTGRIRMFGVSAAERMTAYVDSCVETLKRAQKG